MPTLHAHLGLRVVSKLPLKIKIDFRLANSADQPNGRISPSHTRVGVKVIVPLVALIFVPTKGSHDAQASRICPPLLLITFPSLFLSIDRHKRIVIRLFENSYIIQPSSLDFFYFPSRHPRVIIGPPFPVFALAH